MSSKLNARREKGTVSCADVNECAMIVSGNISPKRHVLTGRKYPMWLKCRAQVAEFSSSLPRVFMTRPRGGPRRSKRCRVTGLVRRSCTFTQDTEHPQRPVWRVKIHGPFPHGTALNLLKSLRQVHHQRSGFLHHSASCPPSRSIVSNSCSVSHPFRTSPAYSEHMRPPVTLCLPFHSATAEALSHSHHRIKVGNNAIGLAEVISKKSVVLAFAGHTPAISASRTGVSLVFHHSTSPTDPGVPSDGTRQLPPPRGTLTGRSSPSERTHP